MRLVRRAHHCRHTRSNPAKHTFLEKHLSLALHIIMNPRLAVGGAASNNPSCKVWDGDNTRPSPFFKLACAKSWTLDAKSAARSARACQVVDMQVGLVAHGTYVCKGPFAPEG